MYLRSATLRNIKCFEEIGLDFSSGRGVRRWTALLGQNGLGKSTLLQALAVPLAGTGAIRELLPVAEGWVRHGADFGEIDAVLLWTEGDAQLPKWPKKSPYEAKFIVTGREPGRLPRALAEADRPTVPSIVGWGGAGARRERERITKGMSRLKKTAYGEGKAGWLACGYGPFRRLSGGSQDADRILYSGRLSARFVTLFREDAALTSATEWLVQLYNTARDGDDGSRRALDIVRGAFRSEILLEPAEIIVDARSTKLRIGSGTPVPFQSLSDGYRAMLALGVDLMRWMIEAFPDVAVPTAQPGVVLIDELDAHLHPRWQQMIGSWLLAKFPKIQFIVATHSPFLAQMADEEGGNVLLQSEQHAVAANSELPKVVAWRADQILTELFGLESTRQPRIRKMLARYLSLERERRQRALTPTELGEFEQLELDLGDMPSGMETTSAVSVVRALESAIRRREQDLSTLE